MTEKKKKKKYVCQKEICLTEIVLEGEKFFLDDTKMRENEIWKNYRYKRLTLEEMETIARKDRILDKEHKQEHLEPSGNLFGMGCGVVLIISGILTAIGGLRFFASGEAADVIWGLGYIAGALFACWIGMKIYEKSKGKRKRIEEDKEP